MLSIEEQDFVYEALVRIASLAPNAKLAVAVALDTELRAMLNDDIPKVIVRQAIALCISDGWRLTPPSIIRLMSLAEILEPRISPIIVRLRTPPAPDPLVAAPRNPFMESVLVWKIPFLERIRIRSGLQALLAPVPTQPFIVVNGPSKLGKSYTADFISHALHGRNDIAPCLVKLAPKEGASVGPSELARDLVARMGGVLAAEPPQVTGLDRWYEELVTWVTDAGMRESFVWWIILDGFNNEQLRPDTRQFIAKLASRFTNAKPQRRFRLILLDFDRTSLPVQPGMILVDNTTTIGRAAVTAFVTAIFQNSAGPIDFTSILDELLEGLGDPVTDLPVLNERLADLIQAAECPA